MPYKNSVIHVAADLPGAGAGPTSLKPSLWKKTTNAMQKGTDMLVKAKVPNLFTPGAAIRRASDMPKFGAKLPQAQHQLKSPFTSVLSGPGKRPRQ
jgi:hypothetical protein